MGRGRRIQIAIEILNIDVQLALANVGQVVPHEKLPFARWRAYGQDRLMERTLWWKVLTPASRSGLGREIRAFVPPVTNRASTGARLHVV